jgi:hypothetical protein
MVRLEDSVIDAECVELLARLFDDLATVREEDDGATCSAYVIKWSL